MKYIEIKAKVGYPFETIPNGLLEALKCAFESHPKAYGFQDIEVESREEPKLAHKIFESVNTTNSLDDKFTVEVCRIIGFNYNRPDAWPFNDITFDPYDASFELKGCRPDLDFSMEQRQEFWDLGFSRCWICYADGSERHYWESQNCPEKQGELKPPRS